MKPVFLPAEIPTDEKPFVGDKNFNKDINHKNYQWSIIITSNNVSPTNNFSTPTRKWMVLKQKIFINKKII